MPAPELNTYLRKVLHNLPADWLNLTTHRLNIYDESQAKTEFTAAFEAHFAANSVDRVALTNLPTAYDYIRLGHPLSCVLEWALAKRFSLPATHVISFSSRTMPLLAILRQNALDGRATRIVNGAALPNQFSAEVVREVYGYSFELVAASELAASTEFAGTTVLYRSDTEEAATEIPAWVDYLVQSYGDSGSILYIGPDHGANISNIQHVRRRETIAMTPANCLRELEKMVGLPVVEPVAQLNLEANRRAVRADIAAVTGTKTQPIVGSSGLSVQYAIMMGLVDDAAARYPGKPIRFVVPPNCYGGTNDQARRVAACLENVTIVDLPVDGDNDMVNSTERALEQLAAEDAVPYIIAEIPTNPRVEVPDLAALKWVLSTKRQTAKGTDAIPPVFILDQTFCPNVHFLGPDDTLSTVPAVAYASGSKFPSGGRCTAGYCVGNALAEPLMTKIERHLLLCDNEATAGQYAVLAEQFPSMLERIEAAYRNTRAFVDFIGRVLPEAKINFVSPELAERGFTPSVFSLDLPTKGATPAEREAHKRALNHRLIKMMITELPEESKYCVSYGQLKGCYWTIPATSTQGTTKEADKDYIARVSLSPDLDLARHQEVFQDFVDSI
ncbi:cystathionine beta-synthase [Lewinella sp. 4G2]|uniref:cystathionine beta-synthase n=1 Tax=Lewinella sp. 4G2 TaxID=1803372 RepID=UPI0007B4E101|nr:cystathionine beta-synthase [Lewinella sp. 4G2]OAV43503.1 cystathionine beta-synthase [Lewinella sp. 4G2]